MDAEINIRLVYLSGDEFYITIPNESLQNTTGCVLNDIYTTCYCRKSLGENNENTGRDY